MKFNNEQLRKAANTVRGLAMDMIEKAKSGHPGAPLGMADLAVSLWLKYLNVDPTKPDWANRDRLVFSGGHASALVYALFHLSGMNELKMDDLRSFRQLGSRTPGHPERGGGVEVTTGPLGQGIAMGVGLALAEKMLKARYNSENFPVIDHRTWVFCGDGDLEEGISHEAASLAGHLKLENLVLIYDSNGITIEGGTDLALGDDAMARFASYGWKCFEVDGHDFDAIDRVYRKAMKVEGQPVFILARTHIGYGAPTKQDSADSHGAPLGAEECAGAKRNLGLDPEKSFWADDDVYDWFEDRAITVHRQYLRWNKLQKDWRAAEPDKAAEYDAACKFALPADIASKIPSFAAGESIATRGACGTVLNALAAEVPTLVGGSADLGPSNKTVIKGAEDIKPGNYSGRNFHFGIRELAMTAIVNGMVAHGGLRAYGATFFVFSDYCRPAIRLGALMKLPSIFIFSHDSFYVGEDGPTHEPVEQLAALRCMPNVLVLRPADANETAYAWLEALNNKTGPTCILTTRQNVPVLEGTSREGVAKGAYVIWENSSHPALTLLASGSEVSLAVAAAKQLAEEGKAVRVVSMPSWKLFEQQDIAYRESVLASSCHKRLVVEAGTRFGWERYTFGPANTRFVTLDSFGASGPYKVLAEHFGFTVENVLAKAHELV